MNPAGTRGERTNNPGNLRFVGIQYDGLADPPQDEHGMCCFRSPTMGVRALAMDLLHKWKHGLKTVNAIIDVYAPPSENDTYAYKRDVCARLGTGPTTEIDLSDYGHLLAFVRAIIWHENGRVIYPADTLGQGCQMALVAAGFAIKPSEESNGLA